jgi:uncharacterized protein (TIGR02996 family)
MMTDRDAFIAGIVANPHDTRRRLVFADWLDDHESSERCHSCPERPGWVKRDGCTLYPSSWAMCLICNGAGCVSNGTAAWAEFIRLQIEVSRREAVERSQRMILFDDAEFNGLLSREQQLWMGGPFCRLREQWQASFPRRAVMLAQDLGDGDPTPPPWLIVRDGFPSEWRGVLSDWRGPEMVTRWPIARVTLTDQRAYPALRSERVAWFHSDVPTGSERRIQYLPTEVFNALRGWDNRGANESQVKWYATRAKADDALSDALLLIARARAAGPRLPA